MTGQNKKRLTVLGPVQFAARIGWQDYQLRRGVRLGVVPAPDRGSRWSVALVDEFAGRADQVRAEVGSLPDMGAARASAYLVRRSTIDVPADAVWELARSGRFTVTDWYRGQPVFDGREVELFAALVVPGGDGLAVLAEAITAGRSLTTDDAVAYLAVRRSDFDHLTRAGLVTPARWVRSSWQRSRTAGNTVAVYRVADLDQVPAAVRAAGIDWAAVQSTVKGRASLLAQLPTADTFTAGTPRHGKTTPAAYFTPGTPGDTGDAGEGSTDAEGVQ